MRDYQGVDIRVGDRFLYQFGTEHHAIGEVFDCGSVEVIKWDDNSIIAVDDFYDAPRDSNILKRL